MSMSRTARRDAAGHRELHLERAGQQPEQPEREASGSTNYEVGSKWDFANGRISLNTAIFRTENRNVIYTVDATAIPPIYNQDDSQRVSGVSVGSIGRITSAWEVFANFALSRQRAGHAERRQSRQAPAADAEVWGSLWTTYRLPMRYRRGRSPCTDEVFINAANTIGRQAITGRWPGRVPGEPELHAAVEPLQSDRQDLHSQHQQQRRPLRPGPAARGAPDLELHVLGAGHAADDSRRADRASRWRTRASSSPARTGSMAA